jgi:hypothetical protein
VLQPERVQLLLESDAITEQSQQALIPLLGGLVLAEGGEIADDDLDAVFLKAVRGADHEGGLAHLTGVEHVAELAATQGLIQLAVRRALDIGRRVGVQRSSGLIEERVGTRWSALYRQG